MKYNAYRDWRDRGLVVRRLGQDKLKSRPKAKGLKKYPSKELASKRIIQTVYWYPDSLISVLEDPETGKMLFNDLWIGQYGVYKQDRGELLKLDFFETVFVAKYFGAKIHHTGKGKEASWREVLREVTKTREFAEPLYEVYEEWRLKAYVVKTGFKFGSHFRIYFPGASPAKEGKWVHSKHVLHVFPKEQKLLVSEWARAVRVAHGVKKTFILAIPEMKKRDFVDYPADYVAYRRKSGLGGLVRENPQEDSPRYLFVPVSEDEHIGGLELASLLRKADELGLELLLSITDRETSITYYVLKKVDLPLSNYEYYEIEWMKP